MNKLRDTDALKFVKVGDFDPAKFKEKNWDIGDHYITESVQGDASRTESQNFGFTGKSQKKKSKVNTT